MLRYHYTESNELGKRLRRVRKAAHMTLQDLADSLNQEYGTHANKGTISKYENGIHEPNASTLFCLAKIIGVSVDFLLGKTDIDYESLTALMKAKAKPGEPAGGTAAEDTQSAAESAAQPVPAEINIPGAVANYSYDMPDNSMSPHYRLGDVLIIRVNVPVIDGQIYLVQYRKNPPVVRQIIKTAKSWILRPENRSFDQQEIAYDQAARDMPRDLKVIGRVIEFRRSEI